MSFLRKLLSSNSLERELTKAIQQEVKAMDNLAVMAPKVYSYQAPSAASTGKGAFAQSQVMMRQVKVEKPSRLSTLFHP